MPGMEKHIDPNGERDEVAEMRLMLHSVCSGADPRVSDMYTELCKIVAEQGGGQNNNLLAQMFPDKEGNNDENRPKAFYQ
eukprot:914725-Prymnesium_polylepis.1